MRIVTTEGDIIEYTSIDKMVAATDYLEDIKAELLKSDAALIELDYNVLEHIESAIEALATMTMLVHGDAVVVGTRIETEKNKRRLIKRISSLKALGGLINAKKSN